MYSIGEISKIVNISVDALRYYDQISLLKPHHIDDKSRYRYYSEDQVRDLLFILEMKEYGFSLDAIRELLLSDNPARIEGALRSRSHELQLEQDKTLKIIQHLNRRLQQFNREGEFNMSKRTVLIVDDAPFMRLMLNDILDNHGYTVVGEAATGEEGIIKFQELNPDIVIMDIHMPGGLDGIQATKRITEINNQAKVLFCSARGQIAQVLLGIQCGAQAFVVKPFQSKNLLDSLSDLIENKWYHRQDLVSRWLSDDTITSNFTEEPVGQEVIHDLLHICSSDKDTSDMDLLELLANIG